MQYVRPGDHLVDQGDPWSATTAAESTADRRDSGRGTAEGLVASGAGPTEVGGGPGQGVPGVLAGAGATGAAVGAKPYLRVFAGCQSEGLVAVKWHEAMPPIPGLLVSGCGAKAPFMWCFDRGVLFGAAAALECCRFYPDSSSPQRLLRCALSCVRSSDVSAVPLCRRVGPHTTFVSISSTNARLAIFPPSFGSAVAVLQLLPLPFVWPCGEGKSCSLREPGASVSGLPNICRGNY